MAMALARGAPPMNKWKTGINNGYTLLKTLVFSNNSLQA
jgi:hypothetical protein